MGAINSKKENGSKKRRRRRKTDEEMKAEEIEHDEIIEELWVTYDKDHNSRIDRKEFEKFMNDICNMIGRKLSHHSYDKLFKRADTDHRGYLSKQQFAKLIKDIIV